MQRIMTSFDFEPRTHYGTFKNELGIIIASDDFGQRPVIFWSRNGISPWPQNELVRVEHHEDEDPTGRPSRERNP